MDYQNLSQRDFGSFRMEPRRPRHHYWLGLAAIPIVIVSFLSFASDRKPSPEPVAAVQTAEQQTLALALPGQEQTDAGAAAAETLEADLAEAVEPAVEEELPLAAAEPVPEAAWNSVTVKSGDSLARIFDRESLSARDLHDIVSLGGATRALTRIHPGDTLQYRTGEAGELVALRYPLDKLNLIEVNRGEQGFEVETITHVPERRLSHAVGNIDSSLFLAAQKAGLTDNLTMELASIFGYDVDFALDIREGDSFSVLYEDLYLNGEFIGHGNILAAEFTNQGHRFQAVRYTDANDATDYYSPDGKSMRKAFLRTPVAFSRISSRFSLGRKHPVLNKIRAHKGVDYAAPTGTPVRATGSGKVILAGTKGGYGRTVILQHGTRYSTLYAHLSRYAKGMHNGARVQQGEVIGYVGSSGLATGPHLHYEFRVSGVHRNPLTVDLPDAAPIRAEFKADFTAKAQTLIAQLETRNQLALAAIQP